MKTTRFLLLACACVLLAPVAWMAADKPSPESAYSEAVKAYVDAASRELRALARDTDAAAKGADGEGEKRFEDVRSKIRHAEQWLDRLKQSDARTFDRNKAEYEDAREAVIEALAEARKPRIPPPASATP